MAEGGETSHGQTPIPSQLERALEDIKRQESGGSQVERSVADIGQYEEDTRNLIDLLQGQPLVEQFLLEIKKNWHPEDLTKKVAEVRDLLAPVSFATPQEYEQAVSKFSSDLLTRAGWRLSRGGKGLSTDTGGSVVERAMKDIGEVEAQVKQQIAEATAPPNTSTAPTK